MEAPRMRWTKGLVADLVARTTKAIGHGSIFLLLGLPLVSLSVCGGSVVEYSGYAALQGVTFPASSFQLPAGQYPDFGRDWWVAAIMVLAFGGIATALLGGVRGALAGIGVAIAAFVVLAQAIAFFADPTGQSWTPEYASGGVKMAFLYVGSVALDLGWLSVRSIAELRRTKTAPKPNRGEWVALAIISTSFLVLIGIALLGILVLALSLR